MAVDAAAAKQAAARRVLTRRRPDRGPQDSEFMPPRDLGEWVDLAVSHLPAGGPYAVVIGILEAARSGEESAVAAVRDVAAEPELPQPYVAFQTLDNLPNGVAEAAPVLAAIKAEWLRGGLATAPPPRARETGEPR